MKIIHNGILKDIDYHFASQLLDRGLATLPDAKPEKVAKEVKPKPEKVAKKK